MTEEMREEISREVARTLLAEMDDEGKDRFIYDSLFSELIGLSTTDLEMAAEILNRDT